MIKMHNIYSCSIFFSFKSSSVCPKYRMLIPRSERCHHSSIRLGRVVIFGYLVCIQPDGLYFENRISGFRPDSAFLPKKIERRNHGKNILICLFKEDKKQIIRQYSGKIGYSVSIYYDILVKKNN